MDDMHGFTFSVCVCVHASACVCTVHLCVRASCSLCVKV